jgi:hydroxyacylglutathione hydrolase
MQVITIKTGTLETNCYLVYDQDRKTGVIIDPGAESRRIEKEVRKIGFAVKAVLLTHAHYDHVSAVPDIADMFRCPVYLHTDDTVLYIAHKQMIFSYGADRLYEGFLFYDMKNGTLTIDGMIFGIIPTPGHSAGCVCIELKEDRILFTGDTLFQGAIGRTDLPGGSISDMRDSLKRLRKGFSGYRIYPGHGDSADMDMELRTNPYLSRQKT